MADQIYWVVLSSGLMGGTTLTEMRREWSIIDLLNAYDIIQYHRAAEKAAYLEAERKHK